MVPETDRSFSGYAWQSGVGGIWNLGDRIAVDAGSRIFGGGWTATREDLSHESLRSPETPLAVGLRAVPRHAAVKPTVVPAWYDAAAAGVR